MWGVAGGIVGARLYHLATSWSEVPDEWWGPFAIWEGGLGVWGGIAGGVIVGAIPIWRAGESIYLFMDAVAPGLLLAQAIGRLGNYFNQELFGRPTDLPWALEIDPDERPASTLRRGDLPPGVSLRAPLERARGRRPDLDRAPLPDQAPGSLRPLRRLVHVPPVLPRAAAGRPSKEFGPLRLNGWSLGRRLLLRRRRVRLVAAA